MTEPPLQSAARIKACRHGNHGVWPDQAHLLFERRRLENSYRFASCCGVDARLTKVFCFGLDVDAEIRDELLFITLVWLVRCDLLRFVAGVALLAGMTGAFRPDAISSINSCFPK